MQPVLSGGQLPVSYTHLDVYKRQVLYTGGVLAAQYITYTPVAMVRVLGVQARYLLPAFLMLFVLLADVYKRQV